MLGTTGQAGPQLEALTLRGDHTNYYRGDARIQTRGWQGEDALAQARVELGTSGQNLRVTALKLNVFEGATTPVAATRIPGSDAVATSVSTSRNTWAAKGSGTGRLAQAAVVAGSHAWHDAVSAIPLAVNKNGPLLLNPLGALDPAVSTELSRVLPAGATVHIPGGTGSLSAAAEDSIRALGFTTRRYSGTDAEGVALSVAQQGIATPAEVAIVNTGSWSDAVSAASAVATTGGAVVYSYAGVVRPATQSWLNSLPPSVKKTAIWTSEPIGYASTEAALIDSEEADLNARVADRFHPNPTGVVITTDTDVTQALAAGSKAAIEEVPLLITDPSTVENAIQWFAEDHSSTSKKVTVVGTQVTQQSAETVTDESIEGFLEGEIVPPNSVPLSSEQLNEIAIVPDWVDAEAATTTSGFSASSTPSPFGYTSRMNDAEEDFCKWPSRWNICAKAWAAKRDAENWMNAEIAYRKTLPPEEAHLRWSDIGRNGGHADSFRHCTWSGIMALDMGAKTAKGFGDRHEAGPKPANMSDAEAARHHVMDYANNALGRYFGDYAKENRKRVGASLQEAADMVKAWCLVAVADGELDFFKE